MLLRSKSVFAFSLRLLLPLALLTAATAEYGNVAGCAHDYSEAAQIAQEGSGPDVARLDADNYGEVTQELQNAIEKRGSYYAHDDGLTKLLRKKNAYGWCKKYCGKLKRYTYTKIVCTTTTACYGGGYNRYGGCKPKTTITVTSTYPVFTASTSTRIDVSTSTEIGETFTKVDTISVPGSSTTTTTTTVTETTTIPIPDNGQDGGTNIVPRGIELPYYLRGYKPWKISSACSNLIPKPTVTVTYTRTQTTHISGGTKTKTEKLSPTHVVTTSKTVPTTIATTQPDTVTSTTETMTTPLVEVSTTTTTTTVCAQATSGVSGFEITLPGSIHGGFGADTAVECCETCYAAPGCVGWVFLGPGFCYYGTGSPPNGGTPSLQCPFGLGGFSLGSGGEAEAQGGPGQCSS